MQNRREFLKAAGGVLAGAAVGAVAGFGLAKGGPGANSGQDGAGRNARMHLSFRPYELELRHTFTVASYSRKTTPGVQVEIEFDGLKGYGEASMPPYLGQSVESVCTFLRKVNLE